MTLTITGRHLAVTPSMRQQVERKLGRVGRLLDSDAVSAQVVLSEERQRYVCEITLHARGDRMLHGVSRDAVLAAAVGGAADKIARQAQNLKDWWKTRRHQAGAAEAPEASGAATPRRQRAQPAAARPKTASRIRRATRPPLRPMSPEDAAMLLDKSDLGFVVFRQADSEAIAILYRRPDGDLGLIEPGE